MLLGRHGAVSQDPVACSSRCLDIRWSGFVGCAVRTKNLSAELVRTAHPSQVGPARLARFPQAPHATTNGGIAYGLGLRVPGYLLPSSQRGKA